MQQLGRVSRLPPLPYSSDPALREFFDDTRRRGGHVINLHLTLAHAPKMALARRATANAIRYDAAIPRLLCELAIVRTAQIAGSAYELNQHLPMALAAGATLHAQSLASAASLPNAAAVPDRKNSSCR